MYNVLFSSIDIILESRSGHFDFPFQSSIGIEPKGDHGQIQRVPSRQEEHHAGHPLISLHQSINRPIGLLPAHPGHHFSSFDPVLFDSNLIVEHDRSPPHRRFSDQHFSPTPSSVFLSTINPHGIHFDNSFHDYEGSRIDFASRQLPQFGQDATIFHRPATAFPTYPIASQFNGNQLQFDNHRRPLTRNHFSGPGDQHFSTFVTPREPNNKFPFGLNNIGHDLVTGRPTFISHSTTIRPPTNAHGIPPHSLNNENSYFLRPMSPRPTTIGHSVYPSPFVHFTGSTPADIFHNSVTPIPGHGGHFNPLSSPSPVTIGYHSTPRPNTIIHEAKPGPTFSDHYLPRVTTIAPPNFFASTISPHRPILSTTARPSLSTTRRIRKQSGRGASRFTPPVSFFGRRPPAIHTRFAAIPPAPHTGTDYSSQYHSGEHLSHEGGHVSVPKYKFVKIFRRPYP